MPYLGGHCASYQIAGAQAGVARYSETEHGSLPRQMNKTIFTLNQFVKVPKLRLYNVNTPLIFKFLIST